MLILKILFFLFTMFFSLPGFCQNSGQNGLAVCTFEGGTENLKEFTSEENIFSFSNEFGIVNVFFDGKSLSEEPNKQSRIEVTFSAVEPFTVGNVIMTSPFIVNFLTEVERQGTSFLIVSQTENLHDPSNPQIELKTTKFLNQETDGTITITLPETFIIKNPKVMDILINKAYVDGDIRKGIKVTKKEQRKIKRALKKAKSNGPVKINCEYSNIKVIN